MNFRKKLANKYRLGYFVIEKFRSTTSEKYMADKKPTKLALLIALLSDYGWHEAEELTNKVSWRFGATIKEARYKGYPIETNHVGKMYSYRLVKS